MEQLLAKGLDSQNIAIMGFSQGACLALEFVARHPRHYGAVIGLTGGLIGPDSTPRDYPGAPRPHARISGDRDRDPHVPLERVEETGRKVLTGAWERWRSFAFSSASRIQSILSRWISAGILPFTMWWIIILTI